MIQPDSALLMATAGVKLTDSIPEINQKLATAAYATELSTMSKDMASKGYSSTYTPGTTPLTEIDSQGVSHTFYGTTKTTPTTPTTGAFVKGTMSSKQFVELALERAGKAYNDVLAKIPAGKMGVIVNATGEIGYIDLTEYQTKLYTQL